MEETLNAVVDGGDEVSGVLGNVDVVVPLAVNIRLTVGQVGAQHSDDAVVVGLDKTPNGGEPSGEVQQVKMLRAPRIFSS